MRNNYLFFLIALCVYFVSCATDDGGVYNDMGEGYIGNENYKEYTEHPFVKASETPISTFAIDADGASYSNARRFINLGQKPPKVSVRIEEFLNYFTFDYPEPTGDELVSYHGEVSNCPWNSEHLLMRIGLKGKTIPETELPPSNYVFLIDVSGSMNASDRIGLLKEGFVRLVDNLKDQDRVAIVTYAGTASVALESTACDKKDVIKKAIEALKANGSTAGYDGLSKAYEIAEKNKIAGGNNRIILGSDGDFNTGPSSVEAMIELVETKRENGIFITVLGVGQGNYNDYMGEQIANNGNGTYEYIDRIEQMDKVFIHEKSKLYTIAKDTKVQLTFNPEQVDSYRLIGYENRLLENTEEFQDDKKDGGEIGVGQTITAIYEVIPAKKTLDSKLADLDIRYKKADSENSSEFSITIKTDEESIKNPSQNTQFAASVAAFGLILRESEYKGNASYSMVLDLASSAIAFDPHGYRAEFIELVRKCSK